MPKAPPDPPGAGGNYTSQEPQLVLRPRFLAWLWILPVSGCGLVLAGCNLIVLAGGQASRDSIGDLVAWCLVGLVILATPIANFINAEVSLANGLVTKRGVFRTVHRWNASDINRIHPYVRWMSGDNDLLDYVVYRFMLSSGTIAFTLSQAWWRTSDIKALAAGLNLTVPTPSRS